MEMIKIKHREFEIIETLSNNSFIGVYKDKKYFIKKYEPHSQEGNEITYAMRKISTSGVSSPKLKWIDNKLGYAVREYIEGRPISEVIASGDLSEDIYKQLFDNAYLAKLNKMTLNYEIDKWILAEDKLVYVYPMFIAYKKEKDLVDHYIRLWFNTKELNEFLTKLGIFYDKSRLKDEYLTNKEVVLMVCKYYR